MSLLVGAAANSATGGYNIDNSLRFRKSAGAHLTRTNSTSGTATTFTISAWVKRGELSTSYFYSWFGSQTGTAAFTFLGFDSSDKLVWRIRNSSASDTTRMETTAVFRDPSAWYHIVLQFDSTESTALDRDKLWVNGEQITSFSSSNTTALNGTPTGTTLTNPYIGRTNTNSSNSYYLDGYLTDYNFIDGQALDPTNFGEYDEDTGAWIPKAYKGTYGTNGFYLDFEDTSSVAALGTDTSGNSNDFTPTNISLTAGTTYDSMADVPTLTDEDTSNFATRNPLAYSPSMTFSNGNLTTNGTLASWYGSASTIFVNSGKWYWETTITVKGTYVQIGAAEEDWAPNNSVGLQSNAYGYYSYNGNAVRDGASTAYGTTYTTGDVIGVALDYDSGAIWFSKNGTWQDGATISEVQAGTTTNAAFTGVTERLTPASSQYGTATQNHNFGQRAFAYTQPTGFKKLNTFNLPDSTIVDGSTNFNTILYAGNSSTNAITDVGFQPDLVWYKRRTGANDQTLIDSVRGGAYALSANGTAAEYGFGGNDLSFTSTGFTLTDTGTQTNASGQNYVAWNWKAASTAAATYVVKVVSDSGNKYRFDDFGTSAVTLNLHETGTYTFDQSDSSNSGHPLRFSSTSDGTHGGGSEYTTGVTVTGTPGSAGAKTVIVVAASAPTLYYYCSVHSGMGGQANTNATKGSSNFNGTIVSTVSANPTAGFSIVTWTKNGGSGARTIGHGLGGVPQIVFFKEVDDPSNWSTYVGVAGSTTRGLLYLNLNAAQTTNDANQWSDTAPTSTVFTYNQTYSFGSNSSAKMLGYFFRSIEGYSKIDTYNGNGSTDGPFVYLGFKPAFIMVKYTVAGISNWMMYDAKRNTSNVVDDYLAANEANAEASKDWLDITANGFKIRNTDNTVASINYTSGGTRTFLYMAFAENPFKNSTAR